MNDDSHETGGRRATPRAPANDRGRPATPNVRAEPRDARGSRGDARNDSPRPGSNDNSREYKEDSMHGDGEPIHSGNSYESTRRFTVEDVHDLAKIGGDLLKRTMSSGFDIIKEVKKELPKEASHLINKGREEIVKGLSKEVLQNVLTATVDRMFAIVREHKLDVTVSVRLKKAVDDAGPTEKDASRDKDRFRR